MNISITQVDFPTEEITKEMGAALREIEPQIEAAMHDVAGQARESLLKHIYEDVYDKWNPSAYERRYTGSGGLASLYASLTESVSSSRILMEYYPSGQHPQWRKPLDGDGMISRIESGTGYEWRKHPGPRPFWTNFVDEMVDRGFGNAFDFAMFAQFGADYEGQTQVEREAIDGDYDK
jgi:hypothetical protein